MKMNLSTKNATFVKSSALGLALAVSAFSASAAPVPYANAGTENAAQYSFIAATTGDIVAYFVGKGEADYTNLLSIQVNGLPVGEYALNNQTSVYGQSFNFGSFNAGDTVLFTIKVAPTGDEWYSNKAFNADGINHVYSAAYAGDEFIPAGTYVAFEDLSGLKGPAIDFDYVDQQFVITNVTAPEVPVPATAWLFGSALVGLAGVARRRS